MLLLKVLDTNISFIIRQWTCRRRQLPRAKFQPGGSKTLTERLNEEYSEKLDAKGKTLEQSALLLKLMSTSKTIGTKSSIISQEKHAAFI